MRDLVRLGALLVALATLVPVRAGDPNPPELDTARVRELISRLGDAEADRRDAAAHQLRALGPPVLPYLRAAARSPSPEIRRRALTVQTTIPLWWATPKKGTPRDKKSGLPLEVVHTVTGIEMALVPAGSFMQGASPDDKNARDHERPARRVRIPKPFYVGKYEVTQAQWMRVMGANPASVRRARAPVTNVSWTDLTRFMEKTSLRIPTESEWEYACRGGTPSPRPGKLDEIAWYRRNSDHELHDVGFKKPNRFGLHDMLGNVWEVCSTPFFDYSRPEESPDDPDTSHTIRGGCYGNPGSVVRASARFELRGNDRGNPWLGFRVACDP